MGESDFNGTKEVNSIVDLAYRTEAQGQAPDTTNQKLHFTRKAIEHFRVHARLRKEMIENDLMLCDELEKHLEKHRKFEKDKL